MKSYDQLLKDKIEYLKELLSKWKDVQKFIDRYNEKIEFLEPLYQSWSVYSEIFKDNAYKERQFYCKITSFLYEYQRNLNIINNKNT